MIVTRAVGLQGALHPSLHLTHVDGFTSCFVALTNHSRRPKLVCMIFPGLSSIRRLHPPRGLWIHFLGGLYPQVSVLHWEYLDARSMPTTLGDLSPGTL